MKGKLWKAGGLFLLVLLLAACGRKTADREINRPGTEESLGTVELPESAESVPDAGSLDAEGIDGRAEAGEGTTNFSAPEARGDIGSDAALPEEETAYDFDMDLEPRGENRFQGGQQSGILTAGEWNDNAEWEFFTRLAQKQIVTFPIYGLNPMRRLVVHVTDGQTLVKNAAVELLDRQGQVIWKAVSDYAGAAYLFYQFTPGEERVPAAVRVDGGKTVLLEAGKQELSIEIQKQEKQEGCDVMFVFDTTGSMGDELSWLQTEFVSIAEATQDQGVRFSVNFYRDHGDNYVVDSHPFTDEVQTTAQILNNAWADGGGDYEEAVEEALSDAVFAHQWREKSVKLLFLVLDAPPHQTERVYESLSSTVKRAASMGIRIIPVASSGINKEAEFLFRTFSILTGGTYTFLTDDSGVGESHLEPTIGSYRTEALNELVIRLIRLYGEGMVFCQ